MTSSPVGSTRSISVAWLTWFPFVSSRAPLKSATLRFFSFIEAFLWYHTPTTTPPSANTWQPVGSPWLSSTECIVFTFSGSPVPRFSLFFYVIGRFFWIPRPVTVTAYPGFKGSLMHIQKYLLFLVHGINHRISHSHQNNLNQCFTVWLFITIPTPCWCFLTSLLLNQMVHVLASLLSFTDHSTLSKDHCGKAPMLSAAMPLSCLLNIPAFANDYHF